MQTGKSWRQDVVASGWAWLVAGGLLLLVDNGRNNIALAAWLAPLFMLRFLRVNRTRLALAAAYIVILATHAFAWRGMIPIPQPFYTPFVMATSAVALLCYLSDRWVADRLPGFAATLAYPLALVTFFYLGGFGLHGSWGSPAYSQAGDLALLQLLSVTGLAGVTFLIGWFAAVANRVWDRGWDSVEGKRSAAIIAAVLAGVVLAGAARLAFFPAGAATVRVASISHPDLQPGIDDAMFDDVMLNRASAAEVAAFRQRSRTMNDDLLARSEQQAQAGARIVFWAEESAAVLNLDEPALLAQGEQLAARRDIYLGMALATVTPGQPHPVENELVMITPQGTPAWRYHKTKLTPSFEQTYEVRGDGRLPVLDTPFGRLSALICYDADFPQYIAQEGRSLHPGVVLDPSSDWRAIDPTHTEMASFRAIEQGFNLVRQTRLGLSAAYDYQGRQLAAMDHFRTADYTLVADVPTQGTRTLYGRWGDWFAWLCIAAFWVVFGAAIAARRRPN